MAQHFRKLAEAFQISESTTLKKLFLSIQETVEGMPGDDETKERIEQALVEHIENALCDSFGLETAIETAYEDEEDGGAQ